MRIASRQVGRSGAATMARVLWARLSAAPPVIKRGPRSRARSRYAMSTVETTPAVRAAAARATGHPKVSVVIPCLNEAANIEECVRRARQAIDEAGIPGQVV